MRLVTRYKYYSHQIKQMSTSTKTDVTNDSASNSGQKENRTETDKVKDEKETIKVKESKFYELVDWLEKWGYKVIDRTKENKIDEIEFQAEIYPLLPYSSGLNTPLFLEFQNDLDDGFIIRTTFNLDKEIESHLKNQKNTAREIALTYIEIEHLVLPLRVSMINSHPSINLYRVVFYNGLKKQFFYDCIIDLVNSMTLVIGKWDSKYYDVKPKSATDQPDDKK
jgi:hypothetical protein